MKKKIIIISIILGILILGISVFLSWDYLVDFFAGSPQTPEENNTEAKVEAIAFPYDTKTPFRVLIPSEGRNEPEGLYQLSQERLEGLADAPLEWEYMSGGHGLNSWKRKIEEGKYPEVVIGKVFTSSEISQYAQEGKLVPLEAYINEENTPNIWKMYRDRPDVKKASVSADGHIYSLPAVKEFLPDYVESVMWINKSWLDRLDLRVPKTLTELKNVLRAFKEKDPNGNGVADEIPLTLFKKHEESYPEVLLSSWGLATRYGSGNHWMTVKKGEVQFAPVTEEWRKMILYYRDLYREGLLDPNAFVQEEEEFLAKLQSETSVVGMIWACENPMLNADEYVAIPPLRASSKVKPVWRVNPKYVGTSDVFCIFKNCKNPGAALRWVDKFYEVEQSIRNAYGEAAENGLFSIKDEAFVWNELPEETLFEDYLYECVLTGGMPCYLPEELYGSQQLPLRDEWVGRMEACRLYKPYLDDEPWPHLSYTPEEEEVISALMSDIAILVNVKLEKWIIDGENLEDGWEPYKTDLESMGLGEVFSIRQSAYERYRTGAMK